MCGAVRADGVVRDGAGRGSGRSVVRADVQCAPMGDGANIRVLLADDHPTMRAGLRAILEGEAGIEVEFR